MPDRIEVAFARQVRRTPDADALVVGTRRFTYRDVDARADAVAVQLRGQGVGRDEYVGVCLDREEWLIPALLGVLRAGAAYVPMDPAHPAERQAFVVGDARLRHVLVDKRQVDAAWLGDARPMVPGDGPLASPDDTGADDSADDSAGDPAGGDGPAYLIYTSGSTGKPKGVVINHGQTLNLVRWAVQTYSAGELRGTLASTSVCFDVSVVEMFAPLLSGGTVILADSLLALADLPARDEVTFLNGVPSVLAVLLGSPLPPSVRTVSPAGEALTRALARRVYANPGVTRLVNCYGPTECTTYCLVAEVTRADLEAAHEPPIGAPIAGAVASVRDEQGRPVPDGAVGELWIAGPVVSSGYLDRPELTAERFPPDPADPARRAYRTGDLVRRVDGVHHYLGRSDHQVKIRGIRVELGEVEAFLAACPGVQHAVVTAPVDAGGDRRLVGYVQGTGPEPIDANRLHDDLSRRLPAHLVPSRIVVLDELPLGPTGKVDRAALPVPDEPTREPIPPRTPVEQFMVGVWAEALGVAPETIGVDDQFIRLGGQSLTAARVVALLRPALDLAVPVRLLFDHPVLADFAAAVEELALAQLARQA
ncbi:non-ribosomal peptide synthetase [Dactylosporangium sp. CS-033363]|uniref:non-ribosomal peptide synthetase n=1 Tax=Dactylosporangium sp. CS-033363 TaxID=3239935 RepID=UPI003D915AB5